MPALLTESLAAGLLAEQVPRLAALEEQVAAAEAELAACQDRLVAGHAGHAEVLTASRAWRLKARRARQRLAESNQQQRRLHQEVEALRGRAQELLAVLRDSEDAAAQGEIRQQRARLLVAIEDRRALLDRAEQQATAARDRARAAQAEVAGLAERRVGGLAELDALRAQLPPPQLFVAACEARLGVAHCELVLGHDPARWREQVAAASAGMVALHEAVGRGTWRLDRHSDLLGARQAVTVEVLFAQVALGDEDRARALFALACPEKLFFPQIFQVFRAWCLGLTLRGDAAALAQLLAEHEYDGGLQGAYARAFLALEARDVGALDQAVAQLCRWEWNFWQRTPARALGVVNIGALALVRLAGRRGLRPKVRAPALPPAGWRP